MKEISLKTVLYAALFALAAAFLSACLMEPVNLTTFLEDEKVIGASAGKVNITRDSDSGLTAGNGRITGLNASKYYVVEERENENGDPVSVQFVSGNGTRSANPLNIGKVSGGAVTGLTNSRWYMVKAAMPLIGNVTYYDISIPPPPMTSVPKIISNGEITLDAPDYHYFLDLSPAIASLARYIIVKIPVSPAGAASIITPVQDNVIALEGKGTVTDYIFVERSNSGGIERFYMLKSTVLGGAVVPGAETNVTVSFTLTDSGAVMTVSGTTISQSAFIASGLTLTLSGAPEGASVSWKYDNNQIGNTAACTVPFNESNPATYKYIIPGAHTISVEVVVNGRTYSKEFTFTVNP